MENPESELKRRLKGGRYALIGAGQLCEMVLDLWPAGLSRPEFILDSNKSGTLRDIEIRNLAGHVPCPEVIYLVAAFKMPVEDIEAFLAQIGQPEILTAYDILEEFTPATFTNGWRNLSAPPDVISEIARLPDFYADAVSRCICEAASAWRYERRLVSNYKVGLETDKYDLSQRGRGGVHYRRVYDCGSYDLSLPAALARSGVTFAHFVALEPDPTRFAVCSSLMPALAASTNAVLDLRCEAVSDCEGMGTFLANGLFSARLVEPDVADAPLIQVQTRTLSDLDAALSDWGAAEDERILIKLHVESAEFAALRGAERLLREKRCDLLINLSHDEVSYRSIPPYLSSLGCFEISLHSHALFGEGLTLFARHIR